MSPFQWNISKHHRQTDEQKLSYFSLKAILNTTLRYTTLENIGKIYHKHKTREKLNCDVSKALEQYFYDKKTSKLV